MYPESERANLELKQQETKSFLKTVSAYANYLDGKIIFGVKPDGAIAGIPDPEKFRLQIENIINDCIDPRPKFNLITIELEGKNLVEVTVFKGHNTPYTYNGAAYKRSDTSSVPVDALELRQLSLEGIQVSYDQLPSPQKDLTFHVLESMLKERIGLRQFSNDTLRTLGLIDKDQYTRAAQLLADENIVNESAISIVRFGRNTSVFLDRKDISRKSLLTQYNEALKMFDKWYAPFDQIVGFERIERDQIPREAFREAVANALVHRRFDINAAVQVAMYNDRIEIVSPGGLPPGMSQMAYLFGQVSQLRNIIIAEIFFRLGLIEKFGTGIFRIRKEYALYAAEPIFDISDNHIRITLPLIDYEAKPKDKDLSDLILLTLESQSPLSRSQLEQMTGYKRSWLNETLRNMVDQQMIEIIGSGPSTKYQIKK